MTTRSLSLFEAGARLQMTESIELTLQSLRAYGPQHDHWVIAWSGGKDSTATLTVVLHFIATGLLAGPKRLTVLYAATPAVLEHLPTDIASLAVFLAITLAVSTLLALLDLHEERANLRKRGYL